MYRRWLHCCRLHAFTRCPIGKPRTLHWPMLFRSILMRPCVSNIPALKNPDWSEKNVEGIWSVYKTLDHAIPTLVSHEETLRGARAHLERRRNASITLSPIRKLSPDLLSHIFILAVESSRVVDVGFHTHQPASLDMANVIASVCSHWRHNAITTSTIRSSIDVSKMGSFENAALWVERAKGCLLDIRVASKAEVLSFPKRDHKTTLLQDLLRPARFRSILLKETNKLANQWLSW
jgi:hypothetical protein